MAKTVGSNPTVSIILTEIRMTDKKPKLADLIKPPQKVFAKDYVWQELYGLNDITKFSSGKKQIGSVTVDGASQHMKGVPGWGSYSSRLQGVDEAIMFKDGTILLAATVSSWGGTFQSHDDIKVLYFALTPKKK